ncbi:MAG: hypothetical protein ACKVOH_03115 [Chlamydiales bacterium]
MDNSTIVNNQASPEEKKLIPLKDFIEKVEKTEGVEEKLRSCIFFMQQALAQSGAPYFRGFWEVRKLCFPLFKENLSGPLRAELWNAYIELTREGRELKNMLDGETAFAVQQIDLAIASLEKELTEFAAAPEAALKQAQEIEFPKQLKSLEEKKRFYARNQKELNLFNLFAARINGLRKELIKTEMRVKQKNSFFQRLSQLGDLVFPRRKQLIKEISSEFESDVHNFVVTHFSEENFSYEKVRRSVFFFREEIKNLQAIAKVLTLNTQAFSSTREELSQCWDRLRGMEKELKKEYAQQKQVSAENVVVVQERIAQLVERFAQTQCSLEEGYKEIDAILHWMRELELTRLDVTALKEAVAKAQEPLDQKRGETDKERKEKELAVERARKGRVEEFKLSLEELQQRMKSGEIETISEKLEEYKRELASLSLTKGERQMLDRSLRLTRDTLTERKEQALLSLSANDRAALDSCKQLLQEKLELRREIKLQLEEYRKVIGGSGLDIEKAMKYNELMAQEKERLEKCDRGIAEIECKVQGIKQKVD